MDSIQPMVEECYKKLDEFTQEIEDSKDIIQRFDEVLLEKASKFALNQLRDEFRDYTLTDHFKELSVKIQNIEKIVKSDIIEIKEHINNYKKEFSNNILTTLRKFSNEVNSHLYHDQPENAVTKRELEQRLDLKIDKFDFETVTKNKADIMKLNE